MAVLIVCWDREFTFQEGATCEYCGEHAPCRPEPFGGGQACKTCWDQIIGGE